MTTLGAPRPAAPGGGRRFGLAWLRDTVDDVARSSPARLALTAFATIIVIFTALLTLPVAREGVDAPSFVDALFTATSAVCVTGLTTVDTAAYWSNFGEAVILIAIKIGGLGILTLATLLGLAVSRRLGLRQRLLAASETRALRLGEVGSLILTIIIASTSIEIVLAAILVPRFVALGESLPEALWHGVFYAVSSFNNAGFVSHAGGLPDGAVGDAWLCIPLAVGVFIGSLGFPVLLMVGRYWRHPSQWNLHTRLTITTSLALLVAGGLVLGAFEWTNRATLGALGIGDRLLATFFMTVMPRSGGFSTVDVGAMNEGTWLATDALMFVGGGSASTAGGIKVTTFAVLVLAVIAEARGDDDVETHRRRVPPATLRLAVTVLLVGATIVLLATLALLAITNLSLDEVLFEVISAFATCGLSTGITGALPDEGKYVLTLLMFVGRTGTMTLAAALALRERKKLYRLPEERPIVG
ncbi:MAG TPA: potassium transporter TrkG [Actinomycetales bacterium]|nr:potassium transporter TrkG [Actinomycetales bacterium]